MDECHDDEDKGEVDGAGYCDDKQHLICAVTHVVVGKSPREGRRRVPLGRGAGRRGAEVHRRFQFPAVFPVVSHRMIPFIVSIMSYRLQTSLLHIDTETGANTTERFSEGTLQESMRSVINCNQSAIKIK